MQIRRSRLVELKRGRYYKLLRRVEAIPAGVYRFEGVSSGSLEFSVGKRRSVRFIVRQVERTLIAPVTYKAGRSQEMSERDFFEQVYENIESGVQEEAATLVDLENAV
jgi:hypothetical protein